ncbi:two-component system response regulator [archaeon]|nr:two-component system response regulator [archaeon]|tara:strand:- start:631 stop:981 length:351 start_codon:yes stop_codon:yes gene_type:complete
MTKSILVVDDDFDDATKTKKVLEKAKYDVQTATNGAKALDMLDTHKFDLILIDIRMPTLSGYDLLQLMRERLNGSSKLIFVSVVPKKDVDMKDIDGFIQKPFSEKTLLAGIKKSLK